MSLIDEYGKNKEKKGENKIIKNLLKSGMSAELIATTANLSLTHVKAVEKKLNQKTNPKSDFKHKKYQHKNNMKNI